MSVRRNPPRKSVKQLGPLKEEAPQTDTDEVKNDSFMKPPSSATEAEPFTNANAHASVTESEPLAQASDPAPSVPHQYLFLCLDPHYYPDPYIPRFRFAYFLEATTATLYVAKVSVDPAGFGKAMLSLCSDFEYASEPTCRRYATLAYNFTIARSEWTMSSPMAVYVPPEVRPYPPQQHNPSTAASSSS